jgi:hypothetical protein
MVAGRVILRNEETKDLVVLQMRFFPMKSGLYWGQNDAVAVILNHGSGSKVSIDSETSSE